MMLCEVIRNLGLSAALLITSRVRKYAEHWIRRDSANPDLHASAKPTRTRSPSPTQTHPSIFGLDTEDSEDGGVLVKANHAPSAAVNFQDSAEIGGRTSPGLDSHGKPKGPKSHTMLGTQLLVAPVELVIDGNPLGLSGLR